MGYNILFLLFLIIAATTSALARGLDIESNNADDNSVIEALINSEEPDIAYFTDSELTNVNHADDDEGSINRNTDNYSPPILENVPGAIGLLHRHGYRAELHDVVTKDGYILQMEHIIGNKDTAKNCPIKRRPVLLVHGLFDSSATWIIQGPNNSLATYLTDLCYDVWLGNTRGNRHSRRHVSLNPDGCREERRDFWSFTWHQIGIFDLPAMIDYVLNSNRQFDKLFYVGHSQGTTSFFVMASTLPEYNDKIQLASCLAPVAIMQNVNSPLGRMLAQLLLLNEETLYDAGTLELLPGEDLMAQMIQMFCGTKIGRDACESFLLSIGGYNPELFNQTVLDDLMIHTPAGSAVGQVVHYAQLMNVPDFREFDYGFSKNEKIYGDHLPPLYNTANIKAPVAFYYSENDLFAATSDVETLANQLPNIVHKHLVEHKQYSHFDFVWGKDLGLWLNDHVVKQIQMADD